jgi:transposase InsO family protein
VAGLDALDVDAEAQPPDREPAETEESGRAGERDGPDHARRHLIHDRDGISARSMDQSIRNLGLTVLKSPPHSPNANAICERVIGTIRRECLDWLIPLSEAQMGSILRAWAGHYDRGARVVVIESLRSTGT